MHKNIRINNDKRHLASTFFLSFCFFLIFHTLLSFVKYYLSGVEIAYRDSITRDLIISADSQGLEAIRNESNSIEITPITDTADLFAGLKGIDSVAAFTPISVAKAAVMAVKEDLLLTDSLNIYRIDSKTYFKVFDTIDIIEGEISTSKSDILISQSLKLRISERGGQRARLLIGIPEAALWSIREIAINGVYAVKAERITGPGIITNSKTLDDFFTAIPNADSQAGFIPCNGQNGLLGGEIIVEKDLVSEMELPDDYFYKLFQLDKETSEAGSQSPPVHFICIKTKDEAGIPVTARSISSLLAARAKNEIVFTWDQAAVKEYGLFYMLAVALLILAGFFFVLLIALFKTGYALMIRTAMLDFPEDFKAPVSISCMPCGTLARLAVSVFSSGFLGIIFSLAIFLVFPCFSGAVPFTNDRIASLISTGIEANGVCIELLLISLACVSACVILLRAIMLETVNSRKIACEIAFVEKEGDAK